jgi:rhamnose utilization protein RhaD (predicted bifunctional aldolase and dehydrogenase)
VRFAHYGAASVKGSGAEDGERHSESEVPAVSIADLNNLEIAAEAADARVLACLPVLSLIHRASRGTLSSTLHEVAVDPAVPGPPPRR